jgi:hypothetical protein
MGQSIWMFRGLALITGWFLKLGMDRRRHHGVWSVGSFFGGSALLWFHLKTRSLIWFWFSKSVVLLLPSWSIL